MATKPTVGTTGPARDTAQRAAFEAMISELPPSLATLARAGRAAVLAAMPGVIETVWPHQHISSYGTGPKKMSEHFAFFNFAKAHMGFGFYYGAELDDPEGLLEGTGAKMRHVKIRARSDLERPALRRLLEQAMRHRVPPLPRE